MSSVTPSLKATDLLAVKSRVSWGAIAAGAMVALAVYFFLTLLGLAIGLEVASRRPVDQGLGLGAGIYSIVTLLLSMFLGGWTTSRLAVGETKLEAVLYGVILWGVLFLGMIWLIGAGVRVGFAAMVSGAVVVDTDDATRRGRRPRRLQQAGRQLQLGSSAASGSSTTWSRPGSTRSRPRRSRPRSRTSSTPSATSPADLINDPGVRARPGSRSRGRPRGTRWPAWRSRWPR